MVSLVSVPADEWVLRRFVPPQGTNFEEVRDIEVTEDGTIWFSSWGNGIARLNETEWQVYSADSGQLPSDFVPSIAWDPELGILWAGTEEGLVAIVRGRAIRVPLPVEASEEPFEISFVHRFETGELWLGAREGAVVSIWPRMIGTSLSIRQSAEVLPSARDNGYVVRGIVEGRDGSRWVARNRAGVMQWIEGEWIHHPSAVTGVKRCDALFEATDGIIWVSGSDFPSGYDGSKWTPSKHPVESKLLTQTSDEHYFLASVTGRVFCGHSGDLDFQEPLAIQPNVRISRVNVIRVLDQTLVWIGTKEGIFLGSRNRWRSRSPRGAIEGKTKGKAFVTSPTDWPLTLRSDGWLVQFNPDTLWWDPVVPLPIDPVNDPRISKPIGDICWIRNGNEIFAADLLTKQVVQRLNLPDGFSMTEMLCHSDGTLYIVGKPGGYYLKEGQWHSAFDPVSIQSIAMSRNGDLLLALENDIQLWRGTTRLPTLHGKNRNRNHPFTFVSETMDGEILAGTRGLGLKVFSDAGEETVSVRDHLLSSRIMAAYQAENGSIWLGFENLGVAVKWGDRWMNYSTSDGVKTGEVRFVGQDPAGDMWIARSNDYIYRLEGDTGAPNTKITNGPSVIGPAETGVVGFDGYDAWGLTKRMDLVYSWRLVALRGEEEEPGEWSTYSRERIMSIPRGLPRGSYRIDVRAQDRDFNTDQTPATHYFEVLPPLWATSAFLVPVGLLGIIAIGLALRLHSSHSKLKIHSQQLDVEVKRRTEELESANDSLEEEKERLVVTLRSIGDGLVVTNEKMKVEIINPAAERLLGISESEGLGKDFSEIVTLQLRNTDTDVPSPVRLALEEQRLVTSDDDICLRKENGDSIEVSYSSAPIMDADRCPVGCVFALQDISYFHRLEEETFKASKLESLGLLAGGIAHDFNNFLTTIMGNLSYAKLLADSTGELGQILSESESASRQASLLTQQLLTFSKGGAPVKTRASIAEAIQHSVEFSLRGSMIKPSFSMSPNLSPIEVDLGQLTQVLQNLSINAIQAMPHGGTLTVSATNVEMERNGRLRPFVQIQVTDQGCGIATADLDRVFDPYFSTKEGGNGLGLSVCYSIMKNHDGVIDIDSETDRGTTVTLAFPAREDTTEAVGRPERPEGGPSVKGSLNVLVMDDEEGIRDLLRRMLERIGHRCEVTVDGDSAIQAFRSGLERSAPFDLVILDLTVKGGKGGCEAIGPILESDPKAVCIASSGYSEDPVLSNYRDYGFSAVLKKPYGIESLKQAIEHATTGRSGRVA